MESYLNSPGSTSDGEITCDIEFTQRVKGQVPFYCMTVGSILNKHCFSYFLFIITKWDGFVISFSFELVIWVWNHLNKTQYRRTMKTIILGINATLRGVRRSKVLSYFPAPAFLSLTCRYTQNIILCQALSPEIQNDIPKIGVYCRIMISTQQVRQR